jgi:hypothetical protein
MKRLLIMLMLAGMFVIATGGVASALIHPIVSADECASATGMASGNPSDPPGVFPSGFQWQNASAEAFAHGNSGGAHCQSPQKKRGNRGRGWRASPLPALLPSGVNSVVPPAEWEIADGTVTYRLLDVGGSKPPSTESPE